MPSAKSADKTDDLKSAVATRERLAHGPFRQYRVGLLHGRLSREERTRVMEEFRAGRIQILVSTVVIEVGIDVPNATVMLIEQADRFGLSQLHQLRGRIGRGVAAGPKAEARCLLFFSAAPTPEAQARLKAVAKTHDGFKIAEEDFRLRGPGEFFGTRQHGLPELVVADLLADAKLLAEARRDAFALVAADPELARPEHAPLAARARQVFAGRLDLGGTA